MMSLGPLRRAWPNILHGTGLGCGAAFVGALTISLFFVGVWAIPALAQGTLTLRDLSPWYPDLGPWAFFVGGAAFCFAAAIIPASLGGGAIGLILHIQAPGSISRSRLGTVVGCSVGGVAGIVSVVVGHLLLYPLLLTAVVLWFGKSAYLGHAAMVLVAIGIAVLAGGWVGRRLACCEGTRAGCMPGSD